MTIPRRRCRSAARACTQASRAPQETSPRARPGPRRPARASAAGRVVGSQSDWQNSTRQIFFAGVKRGLFRRLAAPRRPLIGRPDSNGLNQARNYVASLRSPGGRPEHGAKACYTQSLSSVRMHKLLCARETGQETWPRAPLAVASPRPIDKEHRSSAAGTDSRARAGLNRENNSTSHHGGQEARRTPRSCCECRRGMRDPAPNAKFVS